MHAPRQLGPAFLSKSHAFHLRQTFQNMSSFKAGHSSYLVLWICFSLVLCPPPWTKPQSCELQARPGMT